MKSGYKTTEFLVTLLVIIAGLVGPWILGAETAEKVAGAIVSGAATLGYTVSRTKAKTAGNDASGAGEGLGDVSALANAFQSLFGSKPQESTFIRQCCDCKFHCDNDGPCTPNGPTNANPRCYKDGPHAFGPPGTKFVFAKPYAEQNIKIGDDNLIVKES